MKLRTLLSLVLGLWLGGSLVVLGVVSYNFSGFEDLFARNPKLAEQAGFDPADEAAKKTSVLWVQSAEENRVYFSTWNQAQLVLAGLALLLAAAARAGWRPFGLLVLAGALVALSYFGMEPRLVELGRELDFVARTPAPAGLDTFEHLHALSSIAEAIRIVLVLLASLMVILGARQRPAAQAKTA